MYHELVQESREILRLTNFIVRIANTFRQYQPI